MKHWYHQLKNHTKPEEVCDMECTHVAGKFSSVGRGKVLEVLLRWHHRGVGGGRWMVQLKWFSWSWWWWWWWWWKPVFGHICDWEDANKQRARSPKWPDEPFGDHFEEIAIITIATEIVAIFMKVMTNKMSRCSPIKTILLMMAMF